MVDPKKVLDKPADSVTTETCDLQVLAKVKDEGTGEQGECGDKTGMSNQCKLICITCKQ